MALWLLLAICCVSFWGVRCAFYFIGGAPWEKSRVNISMALLTGILGSAGAISFFLALQHGRASLVVPLSALYPVITIILSLLILNERPSFLQGLGIALAIVASFHCCWGCDGKVIGFRQQADLARVGHGYTVLPRSIHHPCVNC